MAIYHNPDANREINGQSSGDGFTSMNYCRKCGKPVKYIEGTKEGNNDPTFKWRWEHSVCSTCYHDIEDFSKFN